MSGVIIPYKKQQADRLSVYQNLLGMTSNTNYFKTGEISRSCWLIQPNASDCNSIGKSHVFDHGKHEESVNK